MKQVYTIGAIVLFVAAIILGVISFRHARGLSPQTDREQPMPSPVMPIGPDGRPISKGPIAQPPSDQPGNMTQIIATKTFANGTHTVSGVYPMPTPCHKLETNAQVMESFPEQVVLNFKVIDTGDICIQVIDERPWEIKVSASAKATFKATLNGEPAILIFDDQKL